MKKEVYDQLLSPFPASGSCFLFWKHYGALIFFLSWFFQEHIYKSLWGNDTVSVFLIDRSLQILSWYSFPGHRRHLAEVRQMSGQQGWRATESMKHSQTGLRILENQKVTVWSQLPGRSCNSIGTYCVAILHTSYRSFCIFIYKMVISKAWRKKYLSWLWYMRFLL